VPADYDAGINRGLGVPAGFYHFAFEAGSPAGLAEKRDELRARGVETTDIVDHGWARSIYFKDPNGLSLEYCCMVRHSHRGRRDDAGAFHDPARRIGTQQHAQRQSAGAAIGRRRAQALTVAGRQIEGGSSRAIMSDVPLSSDPAV
jgi:hypothetical protein